jgi:hypothetical protein
VPLPVRLIEVKNLPSRIGDDAFGIGFGRSGTRNGSKK